MQQDFVLLLCQLRPANESDIPGLIFNIADFGTLHPKINFLKGKLLIGQEILIYCDKDLSLRPSIGFYT